MSRLGVIVLVAGLLFAIGVALMVDTPSERRRQAMPTPRGDDALEIDLHEPFIDGGVVTRAWAVNPHHAIPGGVPDFENLLEVHRDVGGYDVVVAYSVWPNCPWAPDVRVGMDGDRMEIDVRSVGDDCKSDLMIVHRAVALEFAEGVDPAEITAVHRDP